MTKTDFSDSSWTPGAETREALIAAAMAHLDAGGGAAFLEPVPGTNPPLFIAFGSMANLQGLLASRANLTDH
ncbi:MAG: hypothetical protein EOP39_07995 [Rubrivivax sp.]|nr:MAG: hypothetical protein EOP39_07995 [Rubrivivax sp.]